MASWNLSDASVGVVDSRMARSVMSDRKVAVQSSFLDASMWNPRCLMGEGWVSSSM